MTFWHAPAKLPESRLRVSRLRSNRDIETARLHIPSHIGIKPKMKARAELCQKVIRYSLKDGRMIHRHSMTFWHAPAKLPESLRVSRLYLNRDSETTYPPIL